MNGETYNKVKILYQQFCQQNNIGFQQLNNYLSDDNQYNEQFREYLINKGYQEFIDKYDIDNGKQFYPKQIAEMLCNYKLSESQKQILNKQLLEHYCNSTEIDINYNITPNSQNGRRKVTVGLYLQYLGLPIPEQWINKTDIQDAFDRTLAHIQAGRGQIPNKRLLHNKYLRCVYYTRTQKQHFVYYTIQNMLQERHIQVPEEWSYTQLNENEDSQAMIDFRNGVTLNLQNIDPTYKNIQGDTLAMIMARKGIIPPKKCYHNPADRNIKLESVAMILINNGILPPKEWLQQQNDYDANEIKQLLQQNHLPVPSYYKKEENLSIFDQACNRQIPDITGHKPEEQNEDGWTLAMILALNNIDIPQQLYHDPHIKNIYGNTVEDYIIKNNKIVPKQFQICKHRLYMLQDLHYINQYCIVYNINPTCIISPTYNLNKDQNTVGLFLASRGIVPPKIFMNNIDKENRKGMSIKKYLNKYQYIYICGTFVQKWQIQKLSGICQICFTDGEQNFILTRCKHQICLPCFKNMIFENNVKACPICRQQNWYLKPNQNVTFKKSIRTQDKIQ